MQAVEGVRRRRRRRSTACRSQSRFSSGRRTCAASRSSRARPKKGLANTLLHLWDRWVVASRRAWRAVFTGSARGGHQARARAATTPGWDAPSKFRHPPQFKPMPGFELMAQFRYPVHHAAPIKPPSDVNLAGSSSEFMGPRQGTCSFRSANSSRASTSSKPSSAVSGDDDGVRVGHDGDHQGVEPGDGGVDRRIERRARRCAA